MFAQADGDGGAAQAVFISPSKKKLRSDDALAASLLTQGWTQPGPTKPAAAVKKASK